MTSRISAGAGLEAQEENWDQLIVKVGTDQDKEAFSKLFAHFAPYLKGFLLKSDGVGPEHAEELVQETMLKLWRKAPTYSPSHAAASTWIYTIARNTRIDWIRKHYKENTTELTADDLYDEADAPSPHSSLLRVRNSRTIEDQLKTLPREQIDVLRMMYFDGRSGQQIAEALDIPLGTVKSRIRLALAKLRINLSSTSGEQQ